MSLGRGVSFKSMSLVAGGEKSEASDPAYEEEQDAVDAAGLRMAILLVDREVER
jgi:hypothetical protein